MTRLLVLDTGPLGLAVHANPPVEFAAWWTRVRLGSQPVAVPEIALYELRRELLRLGSQRRLHGLDELVGQSLYLPITTPIILRATELWAEVRRAGRPTAGADALDGDVILAATAQLVVESGEDLLVATTNVRHLERFVPAAHWRDIDV